jgi:hypothetical protein
LLNARKCKFRNADPGREREKLKKSGWDKKVDGK